MEPTKQRANLSRLLRISEFAKFVNLSERSVWSHIASGRLCAIRLGPRATRIEEAELERFIAAAKAGKN